MTSANPIGNGFINFTQHSGTKAIVTDSTAEVKARRREHGNEPSSGTLKRKLSQVSDEPITQRSDDKEQTNSHILTIETTLCALTPERLALYSQYEQTVHDAKPEEITEFGFARFIASSPLYDVNHPELPKGLSSVVRVLPNGADLEVVPCDAAGNIDRTAQEPTLPEGSYHQLYRLDGKLIAVGVVDITPHALSSIYCFYDPAYRHLTVGKFCALMEIDWIRRHSQTRPLLQYYNIGYYVHSCRKMWYKAEFKPTSVLCPTTYTWHPIEQCMPIFEQFR